MIWDSGTIDVRNCSFANNAAAAQSNGGAVRIQSAGACTFADSTFSANAGMGTGAAYIKDTGHAFHGCFFTDS
jgi:hypothetical protein